MDKPHWRLAPSPFHFSKKADFVICTSDKGILFVCKCFLVHSSVFFDNLLCDSAPDETYCNLPVYRAAEDTRTMCAVLRLCYPVADASWDPIAEVVAAPVLPTLRKYIMEDAEQRLRAHVGGSSDALKRDPLKIFAIARQQCWDDVARVAARCLLSIPYRQQAVDPVMRMVTGLDYQLIMDYFWKCSDAVSGFLGTAGKSNSLSITSIIAPNSRAAKMSSASVKCRNLKCQKPFFLKSGGISHRLHPWFKGMMQHAQGVLKDRPGQGLTEPGLVSYAVWLAVRDCPSQKDDCVVALLEVVNLDILRILDEVCDP